MDRSRCSTRTATPSPQSGLLPFPSPRFCCRSSRCCSSVRERGITLQNRAHHPAVYSQGSAVDAGGERAAYKSDEIGNFLGRLKALEQRGRPHGLEKLLLDLPGVSLLLSGEPFDEGGDAFGHRRTG